MKPTNIGQTKFSKIHKGGYRISEVDKFLKKAALHLHKGDEDKLSNELAIVRFALTKRTGYDPKEVDEYLDSLLQSYGSLENSAKRPFESTDRSSFVRQKTIDESGQKPTSVIQSSKLRTLTPPIVSGVGYDREEVDHFLDVVADSLERFENVEGKDLDELRAEQYILTSEQKPLLAGDQVRYALFSVSDNGGYDTLGVDAAVNRLAEALDFHWSRTS